MNKLTILIAEDHALIREAWSLMLGSNPKFQVVQLVTNGIDAVAQAQKIQPDIVIMDINMPGLNGHEATRQIRKCSPSTKVLVVSMHSQPAYARKMLRIGALGYVTKNSSPSEMFTAITEIAGNRKYVCSEIKNAIAETAINGSETRHGFNSLSSREIEIIGFLKQGLSSKKIGLELELSFKTIEVHRYNILKKLRLKNTASLINYVNNNDFN